MKSNFLFVFLLLLCNVSFAQDHHHIFDRQDTLRGSITEERAWWDLEHYQLMVEVNTESKSLNGWNKVSFKVLESHNKMQIDLQEPMQINSVEYNGEDLSYVRDGNVYYIMFQDSLLEGTHHKIKINYEGQPTVAVNPPWDGGLTWTTDNNKKDFIATSCQGEGASMWWPCKDHMYDEPDSMLINIKTPIGLMDVSNGRLRNVELHADSTKTYTWAVVNPINNYGVNINIGDYVTWSEKYPGEKDSLDCSYYVLRDNLEKAQEQFKQVPMMLEAFEYWFGPYPFYEDGYKLVEVPYLGMEHQSSVTYGNKYQNGYLGRDLSGTGWGDEFDFIIIHESGHEWFANNVTYKDMADMWIHESFTAYSENLYLDYHFGKEASAEYVIGTRRAVSNDEPIISHYDVNSSGSGDMYYKGANMLHTIRAIIQDDEKWRSILRGINKTFYHKTVTTEEIENYLIEESGLDLQSIFDQYLRTTMIPTLEYYTKNDKLYYRWSNCVPHFKCPAELLSGDVSLLVYPTIEWDNIEISTLDKKWKLKEDYYAEMKRVSKK
ncbi:M1 family metallopeptidase [Saprospiraceae bacterium]|nr:M1 family metallopeptidase [Saprospiraceae bacterium]